MASPHVVIRADAGAHVGTGHVMRCLSLATELRRRGARVTFVTDSPTTMLDRIRDAACDARLITPATHANDGPGEIWEASRQLDDARSTLERLDSPADILVVDHYGLDATWEEVVAIAASTTMVIDDLANRRHQCDVVTDQNWYGPHTAQRYAAVVPGHCTTLLGPRYAILQPQYRTARLDRRGGEWPPRRVLVSFGGSDTARETEKVAIALSDPDFDSIELSIVVGSPDRVTDELRSLVDRRPRSRLRAGLPSLAPELARADLAIGASGAATWERMCMGVPGIVATTSPHQSGVTAALADAGVTHWVGLTSDTDVDSYCRAVRALVDEPRPWVPAIVDGDGAGRLAEFLIPSGPDDVTIRPGTTDDLPIVVGLESEATGIGPGLLDGPPVWLDEERRAKALMQGGGVRVIEVAGVAVGAVTTGAQLDGPGTPLLVKAVRGTGLEVVVRERVRDPETPG